MFEFQSNKNLYLTTLTANILPFLVGSASTWSSPVIPKLQSYDLSQNPLGRIISKEEASWIGSLSSVGAIFSPLILGYLTHRIGPKISLILVIVPLLVSFLVIAFAEIIELYYFGRIVMGLGIGGLFFSSLVYVVEVAQDANRGLLTASVSASIMGGMIFALSVGPFVSIMVYNLILAALCLLYVPLLWFVAPESPYYLVAHHQDQKAIQSLRFLRRRSTKHLEDEVEVIKNALTARKQGSFMDLFKTRGALKSFLICAVMTIFQQLAGINAFYSYMQTIFDAAGSTDIPSEVGPILVSSVQFMAATISAFLSDKIGRRTLLLVGMTGSALAEVALGLYFYFDNLGNDMSGFNWLPIGSLMVFMLFYKLGAGALCWPMTSELLAPNVKAKGIMILTCLFWLFGFLVSFYFVPLSDAIGMGGSFWFFACCCAVFALFIFFFIFETKGKSLHDIQTIFHKK